MYPKVITLLLLISLALIGEQSGYIPKDSLLVGRWEGEGYHHNQKSHKTLVLNRDGTYMDIITVFSTRKDTSYGTWDQNGNQLTTLSEGDVEMHPFTVKNNTLTLKGYKMPVILKRKK